MGNVTAYPVLSIITPSYNQGEYIEDTIRSICFQKGDFLIDYIIVDGLSSDRSLDIIKKYAREVNRGDIVREIDGVKFYNNAGGKFSGCKGISLRFIHEKDTGHGNAINKGFAMAKGEIYAWLNSDDKYHEGAFQAVVEIFSEYGEIEWLTGHATSWNKQGELVGDFIVYKNIYDYLCGDFKWIQQESTFWRRSLWEKAGSYINEQFRLMVDGELWCRFFLHSELWHADVRLGGYRFHGLNRAIINMDSVLREMHLGIDEMKGYVDPKILKIAEIISGKKVFNLFKDKKISELKYRVVRKMDDNKWVKHDVDYFGYKRSTIKKSLVESDFANKCLSRLVNGKLRQVFRRIYYAIKFKEIK